MFNFKKLVVLLLCAGLVFQAHFGIAGPQGGKVVGGNANISQSGPNTTINQTSDRAIINWNSFDIGKNESVRHNMPSSNSAGLHRVVGKGGPSQIEGLLQSNGNIYLVNPAGVVIHNGAKIDVNGFVATTRDIANDNFMKGKMVFDKPGLPGAAIINHGNISLRDNGLAALVAPTVRNDGIIAGRLGKVALGGGDAAWKLDMTGDDLIAFTMDEKTVNTLHAADGTPLASVRNNGKIKAEGGVVVLSAAQLDGIVGSVVNNGEISAASAETKGGKIIFRGQGNKVDVVNNGQLDVSSNTAEGGIVRMTGQADVTHAGKIDATGKTKGGRVVITGENVTLKSGSRIDASGTNGGGTVLVGGNARGQGPELNAKSTLVQSDAEILASAKLKGNGGQIVVWADEKTQFDGKATARGGENGGDGGFVETSAKLLIIGDPAVVDTSAKNGKAGEWQLDPEDFVIASIGGNVSGDTISKNLEVNDVTIYVSNEGYGNGDIIINDNIKWNSNSTLSLYANNNIYINKNINIDGNYGGISIYPENGSYSLDQEAKITLSGTNPQIMIFGREYTVVNSLETLQNITLNPNGYYFLAKDIDASDSKNWNDGLGFVPIAWDTGFSGVFEGSNHKISNLFIDRTDKKLIDTYGLFGKIYKGKIYNLNIHEANISGKNFVGILTGINDQGTIYNVNTTGDITGYDIVGGLIGQNIYGEILNCSSISKVSGRNLVGGLVGVNGDISTKNHITISSTRDGNISSSYSKCIINDIGDNADVYETPGYFTWRIHNYDIEYYEVINHYYFVPTYRDFGGLIGFSSGKVIDCFSNSAINTPNKDSVIGGLIGTNRGSIENSYSSGNINITSNGHYKEISYNDQLWYRHPINIPDGGMNGYFGGVVGRQDSEYKSENCYWNNSISGQSFSTDEGIYLTESQMKSTSSFNRWDFNQIWDIKEGQGYPELRMIANNKIIIPERPDTSDNPDKPVTDPKPETPVTPEKPSEPTNPNTPSQNPGDVDLTENPYPNGPYISQPNRPGELTIHYIKDNETITIGGESEVVILDENGNIIKSPTSSSFVADNSWKESTSETNNVISPTKAREIMNDLMKAVEKEIGRQIYDSLNDIKKSEEDALDRIKKCIITSPPTKLPDGVYEAFAKVIFEAAKKSEFATYGKDPYEFTKEFAMSFLGGKVSGIKYITINGVTYEINLGGMNLGGVGLNCASVSWKEANNKRHNITLSFVSSANESAQALANYCEALVKMQNNAMQDAIKYFVDDISAGAGSKVVKLIKFGKEVIEAVMDTKKGEELGKNIGEYFASEFTGKTAIIFGDNKFTRFLDCIGVGAEKIKGIVEKYNEVKNLAANFQETYAAGKAALKNRGDLFSSISALSSFSNFSQSSSSALISYLKKEDKSDKSAILSDMTYYERPTTDEFRSLPDSEKVTNFVEEKDGKYRLKM